MLAAGSLPPPANIRKQPMDAFTIPQVAEQIRENVVSRIEGITGLSVTEINIAVNDLHFEGEDETSTRVS